MEPTVKNFNLFLYESKSCLDILAKIINILCFDEFDDINQCYQAQVVFQRITERTRNNRNILYKLEQSHKIDGVFDLFNVTTQEPWFIRYNNFRNTVSHTLVIETLSATSTDHNMDISVAPLPQDPTVYPYIRSEDKQDEYSNAIWENIKQMLFSTFEILIDIIGTQENSFPIE